MRCTFSGFFVARLAAANTAGPKLMFGTNRPSITSTWIQSAPAASTAATSSARRPRSAARIEAAMSVGLIRLNVGERQMDIAHPISVKAQRGTRLFLADVDGALLTRDKVLTEAAKAAVRELRAAGIAFAITSGRPPRGMSMLIEPLALTGPIAGFNGGVLVNADLSVIESHTLELAAARQTVALILERGLDVWVYTETEWLIRDADAPHVAREAWTVKFNARAVPEFTDTHLAHAVKIVGVSDDLERVAACESAARAALGDRASAARSQPYYL